MPGPLLLISVPDQESEEKQVDELPCAARLCLSLRWPYETDERNRIKHLHPTCPQLDSKYLGPSLHPGFSITQDCFLFQVNRHHFSSQAWGSRLSN